MMKYKFIFKLIMWMWAIFCSCLMGFTQEINTPTPAKDVTDTLSVRSRAGAGRQATDTFSSSSLISSNTQDSLQKIMRGVDSIAEIDRMRLNPKKAGLYSSVIPGGGQIYNKEYWKLPIVYGAIGTGVGFIIHNSKNYNAARLEYSKRLSLRSDLNPKYAQYDLYQIQQEQEYYKEYLDMSVLLTSLGYILQIMDAVAFNHLKGFDISPDISMRLKMSPLQHNQVGIGVAFALKYNQ